MLTDVDGGPIGGVHVRIQKLGATRWSTAAHATTDKDGRFTAPVIVRQTAKLRAYYGGDLAVGGEALTSAEVAVSAIPKLTIDVSAKHVGTGQTVTVKVAAKPTRSRVDVTLAKRGRDGRYRTVSRSRVRLHGGAGSVALRFSSPGLYGVTVASPADSKGIAVTAPMIHVRCSRGARASDPTHIEAGGVLESRRAARRSRAPQPRRPPRPARLPARRPRRGRGRCAWPRTAPGRRRRTAGRRRHRRPRPR